MGSSLQAFASLGPFTLQHWPKVKKFKEQTGYDTYSTQAYIFALVVYGAGLRDFHKACGFEKGYGPFTATLANAGFPNNGSHINVDKTRFKGGGAKTKGRKVKVCKQSFNDYLASFPPFGTGLPVWMGL